MIQIFKFPNPEIYIFLTDKYFSSDFDSLEQLLDVNLDDTDKRLLRQEEKGRLLTEQEGFTDGTCLVTLENFKDIHNYPELFV